MRYDAVVIGGGPAGATAALRLARAGWKVAIVERSVFPRRKVCGEYISGTNWRLLEQLDLEQHFADAAGPAVKRVALFAGKLRIDAPLPSPEKTADDRWGRALTRDCLDTLLIEQAQRHGAERLQPFRCRQIERRGNSFACEIVEESSPTGESRALETNVVIAAHGSWNLGPLPTQRDSQPQRPGDLLAFKAHFTDGGLAPDLMPLLTFPGGYGGMVNCQQGVTSLSCCMRRDRLQTIDRAPGQSAGEAVLDHIRRHTPALDPVFAQAKVRDSWLGAGPIQPGVRPRWREGIFVVGNAAGEAHPVVAEGISMAMQSAYLLTECLLKLESGARSSSELDRAGREYSRMWSKAFAPRIHAAAAIAHWAMRPAWVSISLPLVRRRPQLLTWGARLSGKSTLVVEESKRT